MMHVNVCQPWRCLSSSRPWTLRNAKHHAEMLLTRLPLTYTPAHQQSHYNDKSHFSLPLCLRLAVFLIWGFGNEDAERNQILISMVDRDTVFQTQELFCPSVTVRKDRHKSRKLVISRQWHYEKIFTREHAHAFWLGVFKGRPLSVSALISCRYIRSTSCVHVKFLSQKCLSSCEFFNKWVSLCEQFPVYPWCCATKLTFFFFFFFFFNTIMETGYSSQ